MYSIHTSVTPSGFLLMGIGQLLHIHPHSKHLLTKYVGLPESIVACLQILYMKMIEPFINMIHNYLKLKLFSF